jgi:hypothetical protein
MEVYRGKRMDGLVKTVGAFQVIFVDLHIRQQKYG